MPYKSFLPKLRKQLICQQSFAAAFNPGHKWRRLEKPLHCLLKASILSYFIIIIIIIIIITIIIIIKQVLQVIPVKVNYNYFTVHKASSLNLKII